MKQDLKIAFITSPAWGHTVPVKRFIDKLTRHYPNLEVTIYSTDKFLEHFNNHKTCDYKDYFENSVNIDNVVEKSGVKTLLNCFRINNNLTKDPGFATLKEELEGFDVIFVDAVLAPLVLATKSRSAIRTYQTSIAIPNNLKKQIVFRYLDTPIKYELLRSALDTIRCAWQLNQVKKDFEKHNDINLGDYEFTHPHPIKSIIFTSKYFQAFSKKISGPYFVGPMFNQDIHLNKHIKKAHVSLGTISASNHNILDPIVTTLLQHNYDVTVKVPADFSADWLDDPRVKSMTFFDQIAELSSSELFVTHAGKNGVDEAILTQTPMICVPQHSDQFLISARVAELGLGVICDLQVDDNTFSQTLETFEKQKGAYQDALQQAHQKHIECLDCESDFSRLTDDLGLGPISSAEK